MQLKEIAMLIGTELKTKAMDHLVMTHGLRHENINPFIGKRIIGQGIRIRLELLWQRHPFVR